MANNPLTNYIHQLSDVNDNFTTTHIVTYTGTPEQIFFERMKEELMKRPEVSSSKEDEDFKLYCCGMDINYRLNKKNFMVFDIWSNDYKFYSIYVNYTDKEIADCKIKIFCKNDICGTFFLINDFLAILNDCLEVINSEVTK